MAHDHDHGHDHGHDDGGGPRAASRPPTPPVGGYEVLERALRGLLIDKGVLTAEELARPDRPHGQQGRRSRREGGRQGLDRQGIQGAADRRYARRARRLGIDIGTVAEFKVVENTPELHNVIVCTLCSCYPKGLLGVPPAWYKSSAYRSRTVVDPRGVLKEFGVEMPDSVEVRVHDSTADLRYIVLPMRPKGTEGWPEGDLAGLVTRDCMVGTGLPQPSKKREAA